MDIELGQHDRLVFHGTSRSFEAFDSDVAAALTAGDANSALGVHLADGPWDAADYAQSCALLGGRGEPVVLAVVAPAEKPLFDMSYCDFFGYDETGASVMGRAGFAAMRLELLGRGIDCVDYEDGEQTILVALDPARLRVAARLTLAEAAELGGLMEAMPDPQDDTGRLLLLRDVLSRRPAAILP